jgi:hypothetical protein
VAVLSGDGSTAAAGAAAGDVRVWDVVTGHTEGGFRLRVFR